VALRSPVFSCEPLVFSGARAVVVQTALILTQKALCCGEEYSQYWTIRMRTKDAEGPKRIILLVFLAIALYASYSLVQPFIQPILLAMLIGMLAAPAHQRLVTAMRGRESFAAIVTCVLLCMVVLIPALMLMIAVLKQGLDYSILVREWATLENIRDLQSRPIVVQAQSWLEDILPSGALDPDTIRSQALALAGDVGKRFAGVSTSLLGSVSRFVMNFVLLLFVLFFVLRDHDVLIEFLRRALPLSRSQEDVLYREVREVSKSALMGSLMTAVTQGIVGGIGLWIVGFPPVFWGSVMAFTSLIPVVGTALVWVPVALYLVVIGDYQMALFMVFWGVAVVGSIDNFLRPMFMQGASMNTIVVFFSLIGGMQAFGIIGLVYGPLVFALALVLFRMYEKEFSGFLDSQDQN